MDGYKKAVALWQKKNVTNDAELAEALNGHSIAFAYHSGKIENENITYHDTRRYQLGERPCGKADNELFPCPPQPSARNNP